MADKTKKASGSNVHTFEVYVERTTAAAILCVLVENLEDVDPPEFWLPTSQIEITDIDHQKSYYTVDVPEWLAIEKGIL
jgi:hypothetical protein